MGLRFMKDGTAVKQKSRARIYTRKGDLGETSLLHGPRVGKDHKRIVLVGSIDELIALLLLSLTKAQNDKMAQTLRNIATRLVVVKRECLSLDPSKSGVRVVEETQIRILENAVDFWTDLRDSGSLPEEEPSFFPFLTLAYTVCRRVERDATALLRFDPRFSPRIVAWFNRLSDLLLALSDCQKKLGVSLASVPFDPETLNAEFDNELI